MMNLAVRDGFDASFGYDVVFEFLEKYFPKYPIVSNSKDDFGKQKRMERSLALESQQWITYNDRWVNTLVFDIDYPISLRDAYDLSVEKIGLEPTFITETTKGVHIAYVLKDRVAYDWTKTLNLTYLIKVSLTKELEADERGSHRLRGYWRNPLMHNFYASLKLYSLKDFYPVHNKYKERYKSRSVQEQFNNVRIASQIKINNINFRPGNRNFSLWYRAMQETSPKLSESEIRAKVFELHYIYSHHDVTLALPLSELEKISRSVVKYNKNGKNYLSGSSFKKNREYREGAMGLKPIAHELSYKEKGLEVQKRQRDAALFSAQLKKEKTIKAIKDAIYRLKFLLLDTTIRNIAAYSKRSIGTVQKYLKDASISSILVCSFSPDTVIVLSKKKLGVLVESILFYCEINDIYKFIKELKKMNFYVSLE